MIVDLWNSDFLNNPIDLQEAEGEDKDIVVKLTYDALTLTRPSRVDFLTEGE